jgi:hypothetical protein
VCVLPSYISFDFDSSRPQSVAHQAAIQRAQAIQQQQAAHFAAVQAAQQQTAAQVSGRLAVLGVSPSTPISPPPPPIRSLSPMPASLSVSFLSLSLSLSLFLCLCRFIRSQVEAQRVAQASAAEQARLAAIQQNVAQEAAAQQFAAQQAFVGAHAAEMRARGADFTARRNIGIERAEQYRLAQQTAAAHQQLAYQQSVVMAQEQAEQVRAAQMMQAAQAALAQEHQEEQVGAVQVCMRQPLHASRLVSCIDLFA